MISATQQQVIIDRNDQRDHLFIDAVFRNNFHPIILQLNDKYCAILTRTVKQAISDHHR